MNRARRVERARAIAEARAAGLDVDSPDDTAIDVAKTRGLIGEPRQLDGSCRFCHGLAHRRAAPRCRGCGELYEAEVIPRRSVWLDSPIAGFLEWG